MATFLTQWRSHDTGHRVWPGPLLGALFLGLCAATLSVTPAGKELEQRFGLWTLFQLRGAVAPPTEIVIITMPRDTGERISVRREQTGNDPCADLRIDATPPTHRPLGDVVERWGRCHHVELMRRLQAAQPKVIALDVTFRPREDLPRAEDRALGQAIRQLGNVVLAQKIKTRVSPTGERSDHGPVELSREIASAAAGTGPMAVPDVGTDRYDQFWIFKEAGWAAPSLPALALQAYAVDAYPALLATLQQGAPQAAAMLPRDANELMRDGQLQTHMLHLHSIFLNLPDTLRSPDALLKAGGVVPSEAQSKQLRLLLALYTRENWRYLDFYGPPGTFRTIHIADVLAARPSIDTPDPLGLRRKVVFVGYADNAEWERVEKFSTVYGTGLQGTSGVELVATAFANLLEDIGPVPAPGWARFLIAFAIGSGAALLCYVVASLPSMLAVVVSVAAYLGLAVLLFAWAHLWLPVFVPLALAAPLGCAYAAGYKLLDYRFDRAALRDILNQFVPPEIVDALARNANRLGWLRETTNAACVMTDVEGFTTLSTTLEPAQVADLLCEYFEAIFKPIADNGGFVSDLKGDSILAIWTDPDSDPGVRERVCNACLALHAAVDRFNGQHPDSPLPTRIGVSYGKVTLGPVGARPHYEYRAVGDTVNTASRVEQLCKDLGTRLLVTLPVVKGLPQFLVRDLGDYPLRGRRSTTRILELIARIEDALPDQVNLCNRFGEAREAYEAADLARARTELQSILKDVPLDGPSVHLLRLLERQT